MTEIPLAEPQTALTALADIVRLLDGLRKVVDLDSEVGQRRRFREELDRKGITLTQARDKTILGIVSRILDKIDVMVEVIESTEAP